MKRYLHAVKDAQWVRRTGRITQLLGLVAEANGPDVFLGERCEILSPSARAPISAEVVGLRQGKVLLMPYGETRGIGLGSEVVASGEPAQIPVGHVLIGRVVDAFCAPLDGRPLDGFEANYPLYAQPLNPLERTRISAVLETGVRAIDGLLTLGRGQRMGIFAGSGVGKSTLLGMIARNMNADVNVIALVGERGREVRSFIEESLGEEGLKRSVVIAATSDQPALIRSHAALTATAIAEYFRDQGLDVLLTMDSVTRFAMAQREIGLSIGEPPTSRGYTPSVFAALARLLERGGTSDRGSITALYTVLVEGDDLNDPIADAARSILDGHIVLVRELANHGHYPAIDVLASTSRLLADLADEQERRLAQNAVSLLSAYSKSKDMIEIGAYRAGSNPHVDRAVQAMPELERFLRQERHDRTARGDAMERLRALAARQ